MMGDKLALMFWELPEDGSDWFMEVHPNGIIGVRYFNPQTKARGKIEFNDKADLEFIKEVLRRIGFIEKER